MIKIIMLIFNYFRGNNAKRSADSIIEKAKKEAEKNKRDSILEAKEEIHRLKMDADKEIKELALVLLTPDKSAILTGKPGTGKTAIVEGLAYLIQRNEVPEALRNYTIYRVNTTALLTNNGEENRRDVG